MKIFKVTDIKGIVDALIGGQHLALIELDSIEKYQERIFNQFCSLLEEPEEFKKQWLVHSPGLLKPDHGLIPPKGEGYDKKYFFHYSFDLPDLLKKAGVKLGTFYESWLIDCQSVLGIFHRLGEEIISDIDSRPEFKKFQFLRKFKEADLLHKLRLVDYIHEEKGIKNKILAQSHFDQSFLTFQFYESHPGLILGDADSSIRYVYKKRLILCFLGRKAGEHSEGLLEAMPHYVEAESDLKENRLAGIGFIHTTDKIVEVR